MGYLPCFLFLIGILTLGSTHLVDILGAELNLPGSEVSKAINDACVFLPDGIYSFGCLNEYLSCSGGSAYIMKCPSATVLDFPTKQCLAKESVLLCQLKIEIVPDIIELLLESSKFVACDTALDTALQKNICVLFGDGYHGIGCSRNYVGCVGGVPNLMTCPAKLRYDNMTNACETPVNVKACSGLIPTVVHRLLETLQNPTATTSVPVTSTTVSVAKPTSTMSPEIALEIIAEPELLGSMEVENITTEILLPPNPVNIAIYISCQSLADGVYSLGCLPQYVVCVKKVGKLMSCANESLVFDGDKGNCSEPAKVKACIADKLLDMSEPVETYVDTTASMATTTPLAISPSLLDDSKLVEQMDLSTLAELLVGVCKKQPDGFYSIGCNQVYVQCKSGSEILLMCSNGQQAFDSNKQKCLPFAEVTECSYAFEDILSQPVTTVVAPLLVTDATILATPDASTTVPLTEILKKGSSATSTTSDSDPEVFTCLGRIDGVYARNCSDVFVLCKDESAIVFHCQPAYIYDDVSGKCIRRPEECLPPPPVHDESIDDLKKLLPLQTTKEKVMLVFMLEKEKLILSGTEVPLESTTTAPPTTVSVVTHVSPIVTEDSVPTVTMPNISFPVPVLPFIPVVLPFAALPVLSSERYITAKPYSVLPISTTILPVIDSLSGSSHSLLPVAAPITPAPPVPVVAPITPAPPVPVVAPITPAPPVPVVAPITPAPLVPVVAPITLAPPVQVVARITPAPPVPVVASITPALLPVVAPVTPAPLLPVAAPITPAPLLPVAAPITPAPLLPVVAPITPAPLLPAVAPITSAPLLPVLAPITPAPLLPVVAPVTSAPPVPVVATITPAAPPATISYVMIPAVGSMNTAPTLAERPVNSGLTSTVAESAPVSEVVPEVLLPTPTRSTFLVEEDTNANGVLYSAFSCRSNPDGVYPIPGSPTSIVLCHSGESVVLTCPENLVVNEKTMKCGMKSPNTRRKRLALFGLGLRAPLNVYPACYGVGYGVFNYGCSPSYYVSLPRYCNRFVCPAPLVFNAAIQKCASPMYVAACTK